MIISFEIPWLLVLAVILPVLAIALVRRSYRERRARIASMGTESVIMRLIPPNTIRSPRWRMARLGTAAALAGVAVAGPKWGYERTLVRSRGIDMVLALDASLSMMAMDEHPNRLERMKQEVRRLRDASPGDRVGMLAFAGRSYVLSPLTVDVGALDLFLDNLDPSVVGQAGSSLARTIKQGVDLLGLSTSGADRALVVMSDGEAFEPVEEIEAEAKIAKEKGISVVTVGFGTTKGATIPVREGEQTTLKRDEQGQVVVTKYHPEFLQAAATAAGGTFIEAGVTDKAGQIKRALATLRTEARAAYNGENQVQRFQWFLLPAVLLLFLDTILTERRGRRRWNPAAAQAAIAAGLLVVLSGCSRFVKNGDAVAAYHRGDFTGAAKVFRKAVQLGDRHPATLYNLGTSLVSADIADTASGTARAVLAGDSLVRGVEVLAGFEHEQDPELRWRAAFNLGLAHLVHGLRGDDTTDKSTSFDAALAAYKKSLLMRSDNLDAKWNYELALQKKNEQSGGGGGGGGGGNQDQTPPPPQPSGGLAQKQAEQLLGSAAREERDVQAKKQKENRVEPPPTGKSW